jgi:uncharacterized protein (TIGR00255 family)
MTGFGEAHRQADGLAIHVEIRTINSRHFKLSYRSSDGYSALESHVEGLVRENIRRGTVQVSLRVDRQASSEDYRINTVVLEGYRAQLAAAAKRLGLSESASLESFLELPGVVEQQTQDEARDDWGTLAPVLQEALDSVGKMRGEEGQALAADLRANCRQIAEHLEAIADIAPSVVENYRQRLAERVGQALTELNVSLQPTDLLREVCLFTDRSDISEEVVRLRSHLQQFEDAIGLAESSGRKLEFIAQEMGREVNTIGSKANDASISHYVVEIKTALERIREQIQNVE